MSLAAGMPDVIIPFKIAQADLITNTTEDLVAPVDGYVKFVRTTVNKAVTTGGTITVKTGDTLANTVAGLTQTIANSAAKGVRQLTTATAKSTTRKVSRGDRIGLVPAGFATAGEISGYVHIIVADTDGVMPF